MELYRRFFVTPIVVAFLWIGSVATSAQVGPDLFALSWWAMMSALTVCFVVLIRWGMGEDGAAAPPEAAAGQGPKFPLPQGVE